MTGALDKMRILFVTSYPPPFDARSRAAVGHVRSMRAEGHEVQVLSPTPSAAHHHDEFGSWWSLARMIGLFRRFDQVLVNDGLLQTSPLRMALRAAHSVTTWTSPAASLPPTVESDWVWPSERDAAMAEIRSRSARSEMAGTTKPEIGELSARMRRVPPLILPDAASARPGASTAKRIVSRLTAWQLDPVVARINMLRATLIDEFETLERRDGR